MFSTSTPIFFSIFSYFLKNEKIHFSCEIDQKDFDHISALQISTALPPFPPPPLFPSSRALSLSPARTQSFVRTFASLYRPTPIGIAVNTNDAFVGVDSERLSGGSKSFPPAFDAGEKSKISPSGNLSQRDVATRGSVCLASGRFGSGL